MITQEEIKAMRERLLGRHMSRSEEKLVEAYDQMQEAESHLAKEMPEEAALIREKRKELEKQLFGGELIGKPDCVLCGFKHLGAAGVKLTESQTAGSGNKSASTGQTSPNNSWVGILLGAGLIITFIWLLSKKEVGG